MTDIFLDQFLVFIYVFNVYERSNMNKKMYDEDVNEIATQRHK